MYDCNRICFCVCNVSVTKQPIPGLLVKTYLILPYFTLLYRRMPTFGGIQRMTRIYPCNSMITTMYRVVPSILIVPCVLQYCTEVQCPPTRPSGVVSRVLDSLTSSAVSSVLSWLLFCNGNAVCTGRMYVQIYGISSQSSVVCEREV